MITLQIVYKSILEHLDHHLANRNFTLLCLEKICLVKTSTNAIKYAFAKTEDGKISISLTHISDSQILLSIADNGRGLPVDFNSKIGASMGMELLQGLTDDLGGSFSIETHEGTRIKVIFDYKPIATENVSFS